jgi:hypothetical protein
MGRAGRAVDLQSGEELLIVEAGDIVLVPPRMSRKFTNNVPACPS